MPRILDKILSEKNGKTITFGPYDEDSLESLENFRENLEELKNVIDNDMIKNVRNISKGIEIVNKKYYGMKYSGYDKEIYKNLKDISKSIKEILNYIE